MSSSITMTLLPSTTKTPRDILYTSPAEAMAVAENLLQQDTIPANAIPPGTPISVVEVSQLEIGGVANTQADGRLAFEIRFSIPMNYLDPSTGRARVVTVPFRIVAGEMLDYMENKPTLPWKILMIGTGAELEGDIEK